MLPEKFRKSFLLFASIVFYMYGEGSFVLLMILTILTAYASIRFIQSHEKHRTAAAITGSLFSIGILLVFKYSNFFTEQLAELLSLFQIKITPTNFHLPLGISFFSFQAVSCIIDFYRKKDKTGRISLLDTALYISFFPQLVAGPIVRYDNFIPQLKYREVHYAAFLYGLKRFAYGFAKKVLLSNNIAIVVDKIYAADPESLSTPVAWSASLLFCVQLYFDFSGYSDMAIGLARMFGIKIPENFNYPFAATSLGNMWRRWHISLSTWFRDYLYIPLGGSRKGEFRTILNIWIIFLICGLWHGAAWHYILFGSISAFFITVERIFKKHCSFRNRILAHIYTLFVVFPPFFMSVRANSVRHFLQITRAMFVPNFSGLQFSQIFETKTLVATLAGLIFGFPIYKKIEARFGGSVIFKCGEALLLAVLFAIAITSNSMIFSEMFIYFRF